MRRSPLTLAALATAALPQLDVVAARSPHHEGGDFAVASILDSAGARWVVRCPTTPAAGAAMEGEVALLESLAGAAADGRLPFAVPAPAGFARLLEGGRAMVYPELVGDPLEPEALTPGPHLGANLGRALAALHELPVSLVEAAGLAVYEAEEVRRRRLAEVDAASRTGAVPRALLERWEHALENVALWRFRATLVHGDLAPEHVLVVDDRVAAIVDWSESHVGDPADDLAWLMTAAPEDATEAILEAYSLARTVRGDVHLAARAALGGELAVARWLLHGVRRGDEAVVAEARAMLAELAEVVAGEPPIGPERPRIQAGDSGMAQPPEPEPTPAEELSERPV